MKNQLESSIDVSRFQAGPLSSLVPCCWDLIRHRGYTVNVGLDKLRQIWRFSLWLRRRKVGLESLDEVVVETYLAKLKERRKTRGEGATLRLLLECLRDSGVIPGRKIVTGRSPTDRLIEDYKSYLLGERGLGDGTVAGYVAIIRRFLGACFPGDRIDLEKLGTSEISSFVLRDTKTRGRKACQLGTSALRGFFRYLFASGKLTRNLSPCVPTVATWRLSELPHYLEAPQVEHLLRSFDRRTTTGRRNHAILSLLARLGLRAGEVIRLTFADIDWRAGVLLVRGKGGRFDRLPLPEDVGEAIASYLQRRPTLGSSNRVFIHAKAPYTGFANPPNGISCIVRRALKRANLDPPHKGAHLLRHSLATRMLGGGASLFEVSQVLRHNHPQTTEIYAKVHLAALRKLAQPWPGGES